MKRKLALFLVLALIIGLIPANVFAATDNYIDKTPTVKKDEEATVTLTVETKTGTTVTTDDTFKLTLDKAEFVSVVTDVVVQQEVSDTESIFVFPATGATNAAVTITYKATEVGDVKLTVDSMGGPVSGGVYTVGKCVDGGTFAKVSDTVTIGEGGTELKTITIEETAANSLPAGTIVKLRLTKDFEWTSFVASGSYGGVSITSGNGLDSRDLYIQLGDNGDAIGGFYIKGEVTPTSDADFGDVKVTISGDDATTQTLTVGEYKDFTVTVELDDEDVPELWSGRNDGSDDYDVQTIVISEDVEDSLLDNRKIRIEFNEEVTIQSYDVTTEDYDGATDITDLATGKDYVEFTYSGADADKEELKFTFNVLVDADYEGDITATVSGSSIGNETKLVVGKAMLTGKLETKGADVKIGVQNQSMGELVITEPDAGVWAEGDFVDIELPGGFVVDGTPDVEVVKGDIEVEDPVKLTSGGSNYIRVEIANESDEASTIKLVNGTVKLDRTLAEGDYEVSLQGDALVAWGEEVMSVVAFRVITPAPGDTTAGEKVVFTIDSMTYMVGATTVTSDVAPYINENGRTMLPLRALANALGVTDANIMWNEVERSVTIFKGDATVKVVIGDSFFVKNGVVVPMDTTAVIMNGRTMLPLRAIGQALGAVVTWDEATRTVTVE